MASNVESGEKLAFHCEEIDMMDDSRINEQPTTPTMFLCLKLIF